MFCLNLLYYNLTFICFQHWTALIAEFNNSMLNIYVVYEFKFKIYRVVCMGHMNFFLHFSQST